MSPVTDLDHLEIIGDLSAGRPTLGNMTSVSIYRLYSYSLRAVLEAKYRKEESDRIIYQAGKLAGSTIFNSLMSSVSDAEQMFVKMQEIFLKSKIGKVNIDNIDAKHEMYSLVISEDLDCSGLPVDGTTKCTFDEGLISGILSSFFKKEFITKEWRCWGTGEKYCLFKSYPKA